MPQDKHLPAEPPVRNYAGNDETTAEMPADGMLDVHDSDQDILNEEKRHDIASNGPRDAGRPE